MLNETINELMANNTISIMQRKISQQYVQIKYRLTVIMQITIPYFVTMCTTDHICCPYGFYGVNVKIETNFHNIVYIECNQGPQRLRQFHGLFRTFFFSTE